MKVLVIKTSSMGDVIHSLPALTDASKKIPEITFDFVVEEGFAQLPALSRAVDRVIPVAWRRWRKNILKNIFSKEYKTFNEALTAQEYDYVIDAQGLLKSAIIAKKARGIKCGYDKFSAREPLAAFFYQKKINVPKDQHAVTRIRQLFAKTLGYAEPRDLPDYGINVSSLNKDVALTDSVLFIHGTSRASKCWSEYNWCELAKLVAAKNYNVLLPWGNEKERQRADRIAAKFSHVRVLPRISLVDLAGILAAATAAVAVDTGLGHMAAALEVPTISLYGPTSPKLVGTFGNNQQHLVAQLKNDLKSDELVKISVNEVWAALEKLL